MFTADPAEVEEMLEAEIAKINASKHKPQGSTAAATTSRRPAKARVASRAQPWGDETSGCRVASAKTALKGIKAAGGFSLFPRGTTRASKCYFFEAIPSLRGAGAADRHKALQTRGQLML
jgi:hypothetical protein